VALGVWGSARPLTAAALALAMAVGAGAGAAGGPVAAVRQDPVTIDASRPVNTFTPDDALGVALDGMEKGEVATTLTPFNIAKMRSAGLKQVTYRTRPELGIEVWHWTEDGAWSDAAHAQGYWTGADNPAHDAKLTWGYSLPRRGDTIDNANNLGWSMIDDGDPATFWKSNPYLDPRYTGLAEQRPEWIVFSFEKPARVDAARIQWALPFARHYLVQYWDGPDSFSEGKQTADHPGRWRTFPSGDQTIAGDPADTVIRLADHPVASHFMRILMTQSSHTAPPGSTDIRDRLGYAVREVSLGVLKPDGSIDDAVRHAKVRDGQTVVQVSSTDPWHRAIDRDLDTEQPGLGFVFQSGLNAGKPLMVPVGVFYDTPENAAAEIRYIKRRGWPVTQIEAGEEADGQFIRPEDYADLYLQTAKAVHDVDPSLQFGGPSMEGALTGTWPDQAEGASWMGRFVAELKARGGLGEFQFYSFEHYAFDDVCRPLGGMLREETDMLDRIVSTNAADGVPRSIPWVISEYGFSPFAGRAMSEMPSALLAADIVGDFFTLGGHAAYMLGYTPDTPANQNFPCAGYGNMMLFEADDDGVAKWPMPEYFAEKMMLEDWGAPSGLPHRLFVAHTSVNDAEGRPYVAAYPLRAPDGHWSVMLVNRDQFHAYATPIRFADGAALGAGGKLRAVQYSSAQYRWLAKGEESHPTRDRPPARFTLAPGQPLVLPAMSLTVISGAGPSP